MSEYLERCPVCRTVYVAQRGCDECAYRQEQDNAERAERAKWDAELDPGSRHRSRSADEEQAHHDWYVARGYEDEQQRNDRSKEGGDR